ncbi:MAG: helix-turn-helix domain-containing protein [Planctomycetota bacterium]|jgi:DNA-binding transcriptional ArsR family regulator
MTAKQKIEDYLKAHRGRWHNVAHITHHTGLAKGTVQSHLKALKEEGLHQMWHKGVSYYGYYRL